ncbi:MAG: glycosyltransferase family 2 protein [Sciscionella sp.]
MATEALDASYLVVVPAWNEQDCIRGTVSDIQAAMPDTDILVVSDGSVDATAIVARQAGALVVELPYNLGVGGAMRTGFRYAVRHGYTCVIQVDADGQHDPKEIVELLPALRDADIVIGARFASKGGYAVTGPRKWAMKLLSLVLSRMAGTKLTDTTSGFRATGQRALGLFAELYPVEYLGDTVESLVIALRAGMRVRQVPVAMRPRQGGKPSHGAGKATIYLLRALFALVLALVRKWPKRAPTETVTSLGALERGAAN